MSDNLVGKNKKLFEEYLNNPNDIEITNKVYKELDINEVGVGLQINI